MNTPKLSISDLRQVHNADNLEIWSDDGEILYGCLPRGSTDEDIMAAMAFYQRGYSFGIKVGEDNAIRRIHAALGIQSTTQPVPY